MTAWLHAIRVRCLYMLPTSTAPMEKSWVWSVARAGVMVLARAPAPEKSWKRRRQRGELHGVVSLVLFPSTPPGFPSLRSISPARWRYFRTTFFWRALAALPGRAYWLLHRHGREDGFDDLFT